MNDLLPTVLMILGIIILTPLAVAMMMVTVVALTTATADVRSARRMRRHLDDLIKERG